LELGTLCWAPGRPWYLLCQCFNVESLTQLGSRCAACTTLCPWESQRGQFCSIDI